jgi:hypothetical protein
MPVHLDDASRTLPSARQITGGSSYFEQIVMNNLEHISCDFFATHPGAFPMVLVFHKFGPQPLLRRLQIRVTLHVLRGQNSSLGVAADGQRPPSKTVFIKVHSLAL